MSSYFYAGWEINHPNINGSTGIHGEECREVCAGRAVDIIMTPFAGILGSIYSDYDLYASYRELCSVILQHDKNFKIKVEIFFRDPIWDSLDMQEGLREEMYKNLTDLYNINIETLGRQQFSTGFNTLNLKGVQISGDLDVFPAFYFLVKWIYLCRNFAGKGYTFRNIINSYARSGGKSWSAAKAGTAQPSAAMVAYNVGPVFALNILGQRAYYQRILQGHKPDLLEAAGKETFISNYLKSTAL